MIRYYRIKYPGGEGLTRWDSLANKVDGIANSDADDAGYWGIVERLDVENNESPETKDMRREAARDDGGALDYGPRWSTKDGMCYTTLFKDAK